MRRDFRLPEADEAYLDALGLPWETVVDGGQRWLIVHDWPVPPGYNHKTVRAAISIPTAYPDAPLDMVYFSPTLARVDGRTIVAATDYPVLGQTWQRWSRHYTSANPWRVAEDDLSTHLALIDYWLKREFTKEAA